MTVPDTIEPYVGWKVLRVCEQGKLHSPLQSDFCWPIGHKAEASCEAVNHYWEQVPKGQEKLPPHGPMTELEHSFWSGEYWPPRPSYPPIPGYAWSWMQRECHPSPEEECTCGIYVADTPEHCYAYTAEPLLAKGKVVVAKTALWGKTVVGDRGARGQYAYPLALYGNWNPKRRTKVEANYQIPTLDFDLLWGEGMDSLVVPNYVARKKNTVFIVRVASIYFAIAFCVLLLLRMTI